MTDQEYVNEVTAALRDWAARCAGDLSDQDAHDRQWRQRFREFGYGLGDMLARGETTGAAIHSATGSAYSTMYVVNAFNRRPGVVLNAKDVVDEINTGTTLALNDYADRKKRPVTRIEYHSKTDRLGRCSFTLYWMADYHPGHPDGEYRTAERGQCFFADPLKHGHPRPEDACDCGAILTGEADG